MRDQGPDIEASAQSAALLTDQLTAMFPKHLLLNVERVRTAEWDANQLRGQLGLVQAADLDDRLKASFGPLQATG